MQFFLLFCSYGEENDLSNYNREIHSFTHTRYYLKTYSPFFFLIPFNGNTQQKLKEIQVFFVLFGYEKEGEKPFYRIMTLTSTDSRQHNYHSVPFLLVLFLCLVKQNVNTYFFLHIFISFRKRWKKKWHCFISL